MIPPAVILGGGVVLVLQVGVWVLVAATGVRRLATWLFVGMGFASSAGLAISVAHGLWPALDPKLLASLRAAAAVALFSFSTAFAIAYPRWRSRSVRWPVAWAFLPTAFPVALLLLDPRSVVDAEGGPEPFLAGFSSLLIALNWLPAAWIFGYHWLRSPRGPYRSQFLFLLLPALLWSVNDGVGHLQRVGHVELPPGSAFPFLASAANGLRLATVFLILALVVARGIRERFASGEDRVLLAGTLLGYPLALVQFAAGREEATVRLLHFHVDAAIVLLFLYGVLRTQLFDIDLKLKWTLRRGTVVSAFLAAFFVASAIAEQYLQQHGILVGGVAVGTLLFALRPLERAADRLADAAMPQVKDTEEYRLVRKRDVYRAAVESAAADGSITDRERDVLASLQEQLGLKATEARAIEREAVAGRAGGSN